MSLLHTAAKHILRIPHIYSLWLKKIKESWQAATVDERLAGLVALTLPFERVPTVDIAGFTVRLSMLFGSLLIGRCIVAKFKKGHLAPILWPERLLVAFGVWMLVVFVPVGNLKAGLQIVVPTIYVILLALSIGRSVRFKNIPLMMAMICMGGVLASVFGIYQFIGDFAGLPHWLTAMRPEYSWQRFGFPRILSVALEPLFFSAYLLLPLSFVLALFGHEERAARKGALLLLAVLFIGVDVLTVSRGGILALAMLLFVMAIFIAMSGKRRAAMRYIGRLAAVVVVAGLLGLGALSVFNRQGQDSDVTYGARGVTSFIRHIMNTRLTPNKENLEKEDSLAARSTARAYATEVVTKNPRQFLLGIGPGQFNDYNKQNGARADLVVANVLPLDIMLNSGFIGLALLGSAVVMLFLGMLALVCTQNPAAAALAAYMLAIGLQSLTFPTLYITHIWMAIGLALVLLRQKQSRRTTLRSR